jgi:hypothetical protein
MTLPRSCAALDVRLDQVVGRLRLSTRGKASYRVRRFPTGNSGLQAPRACQILRKRAQIQGSRCRFSRPPRQGSCRCLPPRRIKEFGYDVRIRAA